MEVTMRLGKEQSAGYVDDIETDVPQQAAVTAVASSAAQAPESVPMAHEPATVAH
jgi:hypothetical protein